MSTRWSALAAGASRWSAALARSGEAPTTRAIPATAAMPAREAMGEMGERIVCATSSGDRLGVGRWWGLRTSWGIGSSAYPRNVAEGGEARPGVFITLEGPDGSGKSSLLQSLSAALRDGGCDVVATREPGSTPLGEQVRRLVLDTEPKIDRTGR